MFIDEFISRDLSANFDLEIYNELVELANGKFPHLFKDDA